MIFHDMPLVSLCLLYQQQQQKSFLAVHHSPAGHCSRPGQRLVMDFTQKKNAESGEKVTYIVAVDTFSQFVCAQPVDGQTCEDALSE